MNLKIVETSLNLRIERGRDRMDYTLSREVAEKQLALAADVYTNVEFMECMNNAYLKAFTEGGYNLYTAVDERHRGVLIAVKKKYMVEEIASMQEPHMFHVRISKGADYIDLITLRVLVAGSNDADFMNRKRQWDKVMEYIEGLEDKENLVLTGDWNHGVISAVYSEHQARRFFNYQMIVESLKEKKIELCKIDGPSFRGYMKIDHLACGSDVIVKNAEYRDMFTERYAIGIPDHKLIVAELACA